MGHPSAPICNTLIPVRIPRCIRIWLTSQMFPNLNWVIVLNMIIQAGLWSQAAIKLEGQTRRGFSCLWNSLGSAITILMSLLLALFASSSGGVYEWKGFWVVCDNSVKHEATLMCTRSWVQFWAFSSTFPPDEEWILLQLSFSSPVAGWSSFTAPQDVKRETLNLDLGMENTCPKEKWANYEPMLSSLIDFSGALLEAWRQDPVSVPNAK